jgi:predicted dehydrogenase
MKKLLFLLLLPFVFHAKPLRVGIAGMTHGHVGQVYTAIKKPQQDVIIVGFAEPNKELAMSLLKKQNLPDSLWFPSLEALIAKTKPEAIALVAKHPIHLLTNFETTWYPSHAKMWQMVKEEKALGTIRKVVIMDGHRGPKEIGCSPEFLNWLTDPVLNGGGALIDFGCYGANIMTWLMDGRKPMAVTAVTQQLKPDVYPKVDDEASIILTYPDCQAIIQASWNWPFDRKDTEVYGTKGILVADKTNQMRYVTGDRFGQEGMLTLNPLPHDVSNVFPYLAAVVQGRIKPQKDLSSFAINQVVVEILAAARESAKTGKQVVLK